VYAALAAVEQKALEQLQSILVYLGEAECNQLCGVSGFGGF
jgi:hypothetical protein